VVLRAVRKKEALVAGVSNECGTGGEKEGAKPMGYGSERTSWVREQTSPEWRRSRGVKPTPEGGAGWGSGPGLPDYITWKRFRKTKGPRLRD